MRSRDIFGRLRLQLRLRGSISAPAPAPAPSKTVLRLRLRLRLRAKCTGSGGSGSGSGSDDQVLIWVLTSITIFKNAKCQNMTSYWLGSEFECDFFSVFENCHSSSKATGWQWRGHRLLRGRYFIALVLKLLMKNIYNLFFGYLLFRC